MSSQASFSAPASTAGALFAASDSRSATLTGAANCVTNAVGGCQTGDFTTNAGDILIVTQGQYNTEGANTLTDTAGDSFTYLGTVSSATSSVSAYWAVSGESATETVSIGSGAAQSDASVYSFSGAFTTVVSGTPEGSSSSTTSVEANVTVSSAATSAIFVMAWCFVRPAGTSGANLADQSATQGTGQVTDSIGSQAWYELTSITSGTQGGYVNVTSATYLGVIPLALEALPTVPHAPAGLSGRAAGSSIAWSWIQSPGGGIENNTLYLWRGSVCSGTPATYSTGAAATSVTTPELSYSENYSAEVTSWNASGQSPVSSCAVVRTGAPLGVSLAAAPATFTLRAGTDLFANASGGVGPYSYSYSGLPAGCSTSNTTPLACVPTVTGTFAVAVNVTDATGQNATASVLIDILAPQSSTASSSPSIPWSWIVVGVVVVVAVALVVVLRPRRRRPTGDASAPPTTQAP